MMNLSPETEALIRSVRESLEKVVSLGKSLSPDILMILEDVQEPGRLADLVASNLGLKVHEAQEVLAVADPAERLKQVYTCLSRERLKFIKCKFVFNLMPKMKLVECKESIILESKLRLLKLNLVIMMVLMI